MDDEGWTKYSTGSHVAVDGEQLDGVRVSEVDDGAGQGQDHLVDVQRVMIHTAEDALGVVMELADDAGA